MAKKPETPPTPKPEKSRKKAIHAMIEKAEEAGKLPALFTHVEGWFLMHIDSNAFKPDGSIGPCDPED
jgi:hypothetical protein